MSDYSDKNIPLNSRLNSRSVSSKLQICLFSIQSPFTQSITKLLNSNRYELKHFSMAEKLINFVTQYKEQIDCIALVDEAETQKIAQQLWHSQILLPVVIIEAEPAIDSQTKSETDDNISLSELTLSPVVYHPAEIRLYPTQLKEINSYINLAITKFLNLSPNAKNDSLTAEFQANSITKANNSLATQQRRLTNKIKERLGYLGVFYKRNHQDFYRNLTPEKQQNLLDQLSSSYRAILLNYFEENSQINQLIDDFVDRAFFADISTSQILEIHMDLIDDFSHQLRIEGRNDDILLDYRLALIDTIAHLCEMYRRSIPGEDISHR